MILTNNTTPLDLGSTICSIILDLGDVVFTYTSPPNSPLDHGTLKRIINSGPYYIYESGKISKEEAYSNISEKFSIPVEHISTGLSLAADTIQVNADLIAFLKKLRQREGSRLSVYGMSNIAAPEWEILKSKMKKEDLEVFDEVFISAVAHERKPNPGFYNYVINAGKLDVQRTLFIDDKRENIFTARTCKMHAMLWSGSESLLKLKKVFNDPVKSGRAFLKRNAGNLNSVTDSGVILYENFTQMLIQELLEDSSLVNIKYGEGWKTNFFQGNGMLTTPDYPLDDDTMSVSPSLRTDLSKEEIQNIMDQMLRYTNEDGIMLMYWDHSRPRLEPCGSINALTLFYTHDRGNEVEPTTAFIEEMLINRGYIDGTYYYPSAEIFFYFLSRLLLASPAVFKRLGPDFKQRIAERFKISCDSISLAMRVFVAARLFDLVDDHDVSVLVDMQRSDGSWREGCFYTYGIASHKIENVGLTTALAICAIKEVRRVRRGLNARL
ncbi:HAD-like protein [Cyathus striatus]|nr:HAD-like protein [Cyathus striatus]